MKHCTRVGVNVTKLCNWKCLTCFYRHNPDFNKDYSRSLTDVMNETLVGVNKGCDHVVLIGWGEPTLWPPLANFIKECKKINVKTSIITNGSVKISTYETLINAGIDHFHVSMHGLGDTLNSVAGSKTAAKNQSKVIRYLNRVGFYWRSNTTLQKTNFKQLPEIADYCIDNKVKHYVILGFLPHYEWSKPEKLREVAAHPAELKPYIQKAVDKCLNSDVYTTIRYQPMCHLDPKYWPYVVNARYVVYDPWEWCYSNVWPTSQPDEMWQNAVNIGKCVSIKTSPCTECKLQLHCGGWNNTYAQGFNGADLKAITEIPKEYKDIINTRGGLHDLNPVNNLTGSFQ